MAQQEFDLRRILPTGIVIVAIIFVVVFWSRMTITIDAGHAGILFKTFGGGIDTDKTYGEGFHFIAPWNEMIVYEHITDPPKFPRPVQAPWSGADCTR